MKNNITNNGPQCDVSDWNFAGGMSGVTYFYSSKKDKSESGAALKGIAGNQCSNNECSNFQGTYFIADIMFDSVTGDPISCQLSLNGISVADKDLNTDCSLK